MAHWEEETKDWSEPVSSISQLVRSLHGKYVRGPKPELSNFPQKLRAKNSTGVAGHLADFATCYVFEALHEICRRKSRGTNVYVAVNFLKV
jgi:hypothetical protein